MLSWSTFSEKLNQIMYKTNVRMFMKSCFPFEVDSKLIGWYWVFLIIIIPFNNFTENQTYVIVFLK